MKLSRRQLLAASTVAGASVAVPGMASAAPNLVRRDRPTLPSGIASADVTPSSAVVWSKTDRPGRLVVQVTSHGRFDRAIHLRGPKTSADDDFTARLPLRGLRPGQRYDYRLGFEDVNGRIGETLDGSFTTPGRNRPVSFVFTGDTAGQGYGINPELGGMIAYKAMHETGPDFFLHSGDNIYADGPIAAELKVADGTVWKNLVTEEVSKVAETLAEYRGRYKYNLMDQNVRALYADVPLVAQWDDHETLNNWYPGEILTDDRYTEKRVDVLASRAKKAFLEYLPMEHVSGRDRIYRKVSYGPLLDVFVLDMRTYRNANTADQTEPGYILGDAQARWLADALGCETEASEALAPGATLEGLQSATAGRGDTVIAVGHQPDCGRIAAELTGGEEPAFPAAGLVEIDLQ